MLLSLFPLEEIKTRTAKKKAKQSTSSNLSRVCFQGFYIPDLSRNNSNCPSNKQIKMSLDESQDDIVKRITFPTASGDIYVMSVSPSRLRKFPLEFYVRRGTTDEKVVKEVVTRSVYEKRCLVRCLSDTSAKVWLDLGANIGTFSVLAAKRGRRVYAFEPEGENFIMANANIALNGLQDRVTLYERGVAPPTYPHTEVGLHLCNGDKNKYRHTTVTTYPGKKRRRVKKIYCSQLVDVFSKIPEHINGIKMDIEGSEIGILENLRVIPNSLKYLVFEYSFDFARSVGRFHAVISRLRAWFHVEHKKIVGDEKGNYIFFPPACTVYCVRKEERALTEKITYVKKEADIFDRITRELMCVRLPKRMRPSINKDPQQSVVFG